MADDEDKMLDSARRREEATSPIVRLLKRETEPDDYVLAQQLRRVDADPHVLAARLIRVLERDRESSAEELERQLGAAIKEQEKVLDALNDEVRDLKRDTGVGKWIVRGALTGAIAALVFVVQTIAAGAELKGEWRVRIEHIEKALDRLDRHAPPPPPAWQLPGLPKGLPPP